MPELSEWEERNAGGVVDMADRRVAMTEHAVVIAGGGPTGLMLAGELTLAGVGVVIVERRASQELESRRAGGLYSRTIEVLDQRGIADRFLSEGQEAQVTGFARTRLDISDFPTRHNYGLALWQSDIERILAGWVAELEVPIHRELEVTGFAQGDSGVDVEVSDGRSLRAKYLVGCDGARSLIRKAAGIEFPGWDPTTSSLIAEVEMAEEPELGIRTDHRGTHALGKTEYEIRDGEVVYKDGGTVGVMLTEEHVGQYGEPTLRDLSEALISVYGTDYGVHSPTSISRFTDMSRQAAAYREGRVLLAGDAAHVHAPDGGQGLNTGVQDAVNLGWKLAQVVNETSPQSLLDTYHAERHPVAARVLRITMAQVALRRPDERIKALGDIVSELLVMDEPRKRIAGMVSGLDIHYDLGEGHPLLGRRMPDLDLVTSGGELRVFTLLHDARPVLLNLGEPGGFDISPWVDRVQMIDAKYVGPWELPVLGAVPAPTAALIRPDGYVGWVGDLTDPGLPDALTRWFGPPTATGGAPEISPPAEEREFAPRPVSDAVRRWPVLPSAS
jgi:2-polyprenyl-6-methoxyphenol hydroxylase-like FAD-dependent oxidoreductase